MQLDVYAVFARTTNYSLGKTPFESAGPLNLDYPYLCNKQFVLSIFWGHGGSWILKNCFCGYWRKILLSWSHSFVFCHQAQKAFRIVLVSKVLLIFLNLDIQLKDFSTDYILWNRLFFCNFFLPWKLHFLSVSNPNKHTISYSPYALYSESRTDWYRLTLFPDVASWHHFTGTFNHYNVNSVYTEE